jgi:hypothetical protein
MIGKQLGKRPTQPNEGHLHGIIQDHNGISKIKGHAQIVADDDCIFNQYVLCLVLSPIIHLLGPQMIHNALTSDRVVIFLPGTTKETVAHNRGIRCIQEHATGYGQDTSSF